MSYILEALQEAQKNRDDARVPTLQTVQSEPTAKPKKSPGWLMPLVVLLVLGFSGALMYAWLGGSPELTVAPGSELVSVDVPGASPEAAPAPTVVPQTAVPQTAVPQTVVEQAPEVAPATAPPVQPAPPSPPAPAPPSPSAGLADSTAVPATANPPVSAAKAGVAPVREAESSRKVEVASAPVSSSAGAGQQGESRPVVSGADTQPGARLDTAPVAKPGESEPAGVSASPARPDALNEMATPDANETKAVAKGTVATLDAGQQTAAVQSISRPDVSSYVVPELEVTQTEDVVEPEPVAEVAAQRQVPHFRELAYDIQQSLPAIAYSVHLFSAEPSHRMVKIDGRVRREGDTIKPGLVLEEITPTGAIFSYRDTIFRVPVNG